MQMHIFINFLTMHNALDHWMEAVLNKHRGNPNDLSNAQLNDTTLNSVVEGMRNSPIDLLEDTFSWQNTPQGSEYWSNINDEWLITCHQARALIFNIRKGETDPDTLKPTEDTS